MSDRGPTPRLPYLEGSNSWTEKVHKFFLGIYPQGATDDDLEVQLGLRHQTASSRRRDLENHGLVEWTGERRETRSGSTAKVWRATHD